MQKQGINVLTPYNYLLKFLLLQSTWIGIALLLSLASLLNFLHVSVLSSTLEGKINIQFSGKHYSFSDKALRKECCLKSIKLTSEENKATKRP